MQKTRGERAASAGPWLLGFFVFVLVGSGELHPGWHCLPLHSSKRKTSICLCPEGRPGVLLIVHFYGILIMLEEQDWCLRGLSFLHCGCYPLLNCLVWSGLASSLSEMIIRRGHCAKASDSCLVNMQLSFKSSEQPAVPAWSRAVLLHRQHRTWSAFFRCGHA